MLPRANTALAFFLLVLQGLLPALALAPAGTGIRTLTIAMQAMLRELPTHAYLPVGFLFKNQQEKCTKAACNLMKPAACMQLYDTT